jgi:hypothetical protein
MSKLSIPKREARLRNTQHRWCSLSMSNRGTKIEPVIDCSRQVNGNLPNSNGPESGALNEHEITATR